MIYCMEFFAGVEERGELCRQTDKRTRKSIVDFQKSQRDETKVWRKITSKRSLADTRYNELKDYNK